MGVDMNQSALQNTARGIGRSGRKRGVVMQENFDQALTKRGREIYGLIGVKPLRIRQRIHNGKRGFSDLLGQDAYLVKG